jgi:hypothetical protein
VKSEVTSAQLAEVQRRREPAVKAIRRFQGYVQDRVLKTALGNNHPFQVPWPARLVLSIPILRDDPAKLIAFGITPARIEELS